MVKSRVSSLDTNILLRLVLNDVPEQVKALQGLLGEGRYEISDAAIIEMVYVLEKFYKIDRVDVVQNVNFIVQHPQFVCNKSLFKQILPMYAIETALSIVDCAVLGYARLNKATPLYTFDKKLVSKSDGDAAQP